MKNSIRVIIASALLVAPVAAFARPLPQARPRTQTVTNRAPVVRTQAITPHR